ncbi:D-amino-acid transaminase [Humisphaera borealis]|uniref:D-alanine aminotransferase n=1 Tax=Humisphaera borealis TaxID=2807512 RepID=A0A7M2WQS2_9BACT|nr:D-amino-acid transaminase [Humisphaera borealis]QOV87887.1 D-amino-acid transaminase [Humisphaera borealis]
MSELVYINGEIIPMADARIGVEDRGYQFADGVYEVFRLYNGRPFTFKEHLDRLERSAAGIKLALPTPRTELEAGLLKLVDRSGVREGMIYLQATRGVAPRNHVFPESPSGTVVAYCRPLPPIPNPGEGEGAKLMAVPDERWKRCWIKSIALLANVLAKNEAVSQGYDEAVFVENGVVTECSASNVFAIINGKIVTHPVGSKVLPGITREVLFQCAAELKIEVDERTLMESEAVRAQELFITSTTREISWVARWNEKYIGQGRCGPLTAKLHRAIQQRVRQETNG